MEVCLLGFSCFCSSSVGEAAVVSKLASFGGVSIVLVAWGGELFSSVKVEGFFDGACRKVLGGARVSATNSVCIAAPLAS